MAKLQDLQALRAIVPEANPMVAMKVRESLDEQGVDFIARAPFLIMSTIGSDGLPDVSPKGDEPGFVHVENAGSILIPDRPGNNLAFGLSNIIANGKIAVIFIAPNAGETLRVSGVASLHDDPDMCERLSARGRPAKLFIRVAIKRAYFHCARSVLRAGLWDSATWGAPHKISFGRVMREQLQLEEKAVSLIDANVDASYRDL